MNARRVIKFSIDEGRTDFARVLQVAHGTGCEILWRTPLEEEADRFTWAIAGRDYQLLALLAELGFVSKPYVLDGITYTVPESMEVH